MAHKKQQKTAFVSGGNRGIGKGIVQALKREGYWVAACCSRKAGLKALAPADLPLVCDVGDPRQVEAAVRETLKECGQLDVLVNNAGIIEDTDFQSTDSDASWLRTMDVNVNGPYFLIRHFLPRMRKGGSIVNISSILGLKGAPGAAAYCASKHAVVGMTRSLAYDLGSRGLTVNAICPGWVDTDMARSRMAGIGLNKKSAAESSPTGRIASPADVAAAVVFFASAGARQINGQTLVINGGESA